MERTPRQQDTQYAYKTTIKETYGLPESWIKRLGPPDKVVRNPHYRSRQSMLYLRARVEAFIEANQAEYDAMRQRQQLHAQHATATATAARNRLITWANSVEIEIKPLPQSKRRLEQETVEQHRQFFQDTRNDIATPFTLSENAIVAYVRHNYTNYDDLISQIERQVGVLAAYDIIKKRVNDLINQQLVAQFGPGE